MYVQDKVYQELQAAAKAGTQIVVDSYCKQTYPNMTSLKIKYEIWWSLSKDQQGRVFRGAARPGWRS